jgi:TRAP-type C4-dicarboxylate transport system substrate-binding protein
MPEITWSKEAQEIFDKVITNLPQFHRSIAQKLVKESAEEIAESRGLTTVEKKELVEAFFKEIPPAFKDMMKRLFHKLNIDYTQYIQETNK